MSSPRPEPSRGDARDLGQLGYAQELVRSMGGFSNFAVSFSIISILTGAFTGYDWGLAWGGPFVMGVGWPLVALGSLTVALVMAELASAFPTAGALYHWAALLGGRRIGWFTAWFNLVGQFTITAGIDYGLAQFLVSLMGWPADHGRVLLVYALVLASHAGLNHYGVRLVARLNDASVVVHMVGVVVIVGTLLAFADLAPIGTVFTPGTPAKVTAGQGGLAFCFLVGLLQAQWTFTGFDASAHVSEETVDPRTRAPWGIVLSVVVSALVGWVMLIVVTLAITDYDAVIEASNGGKKAIQHIFETALAGLGAWAGRVLTLFAALAMWFCGLASVTANSRMLYAFARDGGVPASGLLKQVAPWNGAPVAAIWASVAAAFLLLAWAKAYDTVLAISTMALYVGYGIPIVLWLRAGPERRERDRGPWHLGRWTVPVGVVAILWVTGVVVLFSIPPNELAGKALAGVTVALVAGWWLHARKAFAGPPIPRVGRGSPV